LTKYFKDLKFDFERFNIIFYWLPRHVGISGNEKADIAAKSALNKMILRIAIPYTDLKRIINKYIHDKWLQTWNSQTLLLFVYLWYDLYNR